MKVLLVEDSKEIQEAISLTFELHWPDAEVVVASEGLVGITMVGPG